MATEGKKITVDVRKNMFFPFRISYRFTQDHPFLLGMVFFLYILYSYCPALLAFLVSSSPVLVCTTLLLGILLVYSEPDICETKENKRQDISSLKGSVNVNDDNSDAAHKLVDNSDAGSSGSSLDIESDDDSAEEEAEKARENDDTIEAVVTWTADDQKNLTDLGTSEIERNQRLEKLIEKRRARKFLSFHVRNNLIDLDCNDPVAKTNDLYRFQRKIPSVSAPRHNPFDPPFEAEETAGLPPIPCSAPSVLLPRPNPFDFPLQRFEDSVDLSRGTRNHQEREMFHQRHESFASGPSFSGDSKLKPDLFPPRMHSEGVGLANSQRQSTEKSDSKASSTHESDTDPSAVDHEELLEEFHMESHVLLSENHCAEPVGAVEMEIRQGDFHSTDPQDEKLEVIEGRYDDSSSLSSEKNSTMTIDGNSVNLELARNDAKEVSGYVSVSKSVDEGFSSATGHWVAPPSLATVDDIEPMAKEVSEIGTSDASLIPKSRLKDFRVGSASSAGLSGLQLIAKVSRDKLEDKASNSSGKSALGKVRNGVLVNLI